MRWTFRISFLLILAWLFFLVSPFLALRDLASAVEAKDVPRIAERVNFRALRVSLSRQILAAYLKTPDGQRELGGINRQAATEAGATVLDPLIEDLVTPQALADLLRNGAPPPAAGVSGGGAPPLQLDLRSASEAWRVFIASESQGFRSITIPLPPSAEKNEQFRLTMRLNWAGWRLSGVDLPQSLREQLIKRANQMMSQQSNQLR